MIRKKREKKQDGCQSLAFPSFYRQAELLAKPAPSAGLFQNTHPDAILQYSPLINMWCMRFEAKHQYVKNVIKKANNFKNPMKTIAKKHCRYMTYHLSAIDFFSSPIEVIRPKSVHKSLIDTNLCLHLDNVSESPIECYVLCKNTSFNEMEYSVGHILCFNHRSSVTFAEVKSIWFLNSSIFFWCQLNNSQYNEHFQIYELISTEDFALFSTKELKDYYPLNTYKVKIYKEKAVSLHHSIEMPI